MKTLEITQNQPTNYYTEAAKYIGTGIILAAAISLAAFGVHFAFNAASALSLNTYLYAPLITGCAFATAIKVIGFINAPKENKLATKETDKPTSSTVETVKKWAMTGLVLAAAIGLAALGSHFLLNMATPLSLKDCVYIPLLSGFGFATALKLMESIDTDEESNNWMKIAKWVATGLLLTTAIGVVALGGHFILNAPPPLSLEAYAYTPLISGFAFATAIKGIDYINAEPPTEKFYVEEEEEPYPPLPNGTGSPDSCYSDYEADMEDSENEEEDIIYRATPPVSSDSVNYEADTEDSEDEAS